MATRTYRLYGVTLATPLVLPCRPALGRQTPDVRLIPAPAAAFRAARRVLRRQPASWFHSCRLDDGATYLRWSGLFEFLISSDGRRVRYRRHPRASRESLTVYLLGQVLSFVLLARQVESLHGSIVVVGRQAVAFVGDCGDGKSTLGAAFVARGYRMLTDDLIVAEERARGWVAHPGIPRLKLFPSVAKRMLPAYRGRTPMHRATAKLVIPLVDRQALRRIVPLTAIYVLARPDRRQPRSVPHIEALSGSEAFREIARAAFNVMVIERPRLAAHFRFATRLATSVPVRRLTYERRLSTLPAVCDAVLADLARRSA